MNITVKAETVRPINHNSGCLRAKDIKPLKDIVALMTNCDSNEDIFNYARQIINNGIRTNKANGNEYNIKIIKETICRNTTQGDMMTFRSLSSVYRELFGVTDRHYAHCSHALLAALNDLVNDGYLERQRMYYKENDWDRGYQTNVYIVV